MKIALIGDFSSVHNYLRTALQKLGHNVVLFSSGDGYRNYYRDIDLSIKKNNKIFRVMSRIAKEASLVNILQGFDVVQFISSKFFIKFSPKHLLYNEIVKKNDKVFSLIAGITFQPLAEQIKLIDKGNIDEKELSNILNHLKYRRKITSNRTTRFLINKFDGFIPVAYDYYRYLKTLGYCKPLINFPINVDEIEFIHNNRVEKMKILHSVTSGREHVKGSFYFDEAISILKKKYPNDIEYIRCHDVPFDEYQKKIAEANIVFDQVYSHSPGMNALISMAKGKVVFSGFSDEYMEYLSVNEKPGINAKPDTSYLVSQIENLLTDDQSIMKYSIRARKFVEDFHDSNFIAKEYVKTWGI